VPPRASRARLGVLSEARALSRPFGPAYAGAVSERRDKLGPPRFVCDERVRIVRATGDETNDNGKPVDAARLVGATVEVRDARPTSGRDSWQISVYVDPTYVDRIDRAEVVATFDPLEWWFSEDSLERAGLPPEWEEEIPAWARWRDNVDLNLVSDVIYEDPGTDDFTEEEGAVETIAESAVSALRELVETEQVTWSHSVSDQEPIEIQIELHPSGDVLAAYQRIIAAPVAAWLHGEDRRGFPTSRWEPPHSEEAVFLVPGIDSAEVTCNHWSTPERLTTPVTRTKARSRNTRDPG
jgi:hypothetical protein